MPQEQETEGILLHLLDFKEKQQILTVLSSSQGLQKFIIYKNKRSPLSLMIELEICYQAKASGLHKVLTIMPSKYHLKLRKNLEVLMLAGKMARIILQTQMPNQPSPMLYQLFRSYLNYLPKAQNFNALLASFYLKLLKHEGLLLERDHFLSLSSLKTFAAIESIAVDASLLTELKQLLEPLKSKLESLS